jgi:hypothetical protein
VRGSVVRPQIDCSAHAIGGLFMPPGSGCKNTQIVMDLGVAWVYGKRVLVALHCFGSAPQGVKRIPHCHERICKVRLDSDGSLVVVQGTLMVAGATVEVSQIEMGCRIARIAGYRQVVRGARLIYLATRK